MMSFVFKIALLSIFVFYTEFSLLNTIPAKAKIITTDYFEQLYICENNVLKKYDRNGTLLSVFSNQIHGEISSIDVSDPYILLLFYNDLNRIIFLDDRLAPIGKPFDFDKIDLFNVSVVCKSKNFAVWLYDRFDNRLIQYGQNPKGIIQQFNLDPLNIAQEIIFMLESGNNLYLNTGKQLLIFDQYGSYVKSINIEIKKAFQLRNNHIIYFKDNKLFNTSVKELITDTLKIDFTQNMKHAIIENERLYIQKEDSIFIYAIKP